MTELMDRALAEIRAIVDEHDGCATPAFTPAVSLTRVADGSSTGANLIPAILRRMSAEDIDIIDGNRNVADGQVRGSRGDWAAALVAAVDLVRRNPSLRLEDITADQIVGAATAFHAQVERAATTAHTPQP